jgi:hypothetical protein
MRTCVDDSMPISVDDQDLSFLKRARVNLRKIDGQKSSSLSRARSIIYVKTIWTARLDTTTTDE